MATTVTVYRYEKVDANPTDGLFDGLILGLKATDTTNPNKVAYYDRQVSITPTANPTKTEVDAEVTNILASAADPSGLNTTQTVQQYLDERAASWTSAPSIIPDDYANLV